MVKKVVTEFWSSRWTFLFAAVGAAVGLGNIWKFPYITGKEGGGLFVLTYLVCIFFIGLPILIAELLIGKLGKNEPVASMRSLIQQNKSSKAWAIFGFLGVLAGFLILSYYAVVAGWTLNYLVKSIWGDMHHLSALQVTKQFDLMLSHPLQMIFFQAIIVLLIIVTVLQGLRKGIERSVILMCPLMIICLAILIFYAYKTGRFAQAIHFLFYPNFNNITADSFLVALGHAFFSLSLAVGTMMIYGAYLPKRASVVKAGVIIVLADTGFALLAGLAIFPIVFAHDSVDVAAGTGLVFKTLPIIFASMPYGRIFSVLFFLLLFFASFTSAISLLEPSVGWVMRVFNRSRKQATVITGLIIFMLGLPTVLSFNHWKAATLFGHNFFQLVDYITANVMMPFIGLGLALFAGYVITKLIPKDEFPNKTMFNTWLWSLRTICPLGVFLIFYHAIFS